jgi:hypothetical protein
MMSTPIDRVPDWLLERLAAGELPGDQARSLRARLAAAGEDGRLDDLRTSDAETLAAHPVAEVAAEVRRRAAQAGCATRQRPARGSLWALPLALAGTTALVLLGVRAVDRGEAPITSLPQPPEVTRSKGIAPSLKLYRRTAAGVEALAPTSTVRPGDNLQIRYVAAGAGHGVVASVDARGTVTLHLPELPGSSAVLEKSGERALAHSFELDASPGFERFVFVTAAKAFATDLVAQALARGQPLPEGFKTWEITLRKEAP